MMNPMSILQNAAANSPIGRINQMVQAGNNPQALLQMMIQQRYPVYPGEKFSAITDYILQFVQTA